MTNVVRVKISISFRDVRVNPVTHGQLKGLGGSDVLMRKNTLGTGRSGQKADSFNET